MPVREILVKHTTRKYPRYKSDPSGNSRGQRALPDESTATRANETHSECPIARYVSLSKNRGLKGPMPVALHFKNVARGPIGSLRRAVNQKCPPMSSWGVHFVGEMCLEAAVRDGTEEGFLQELDKYGIRHAPNFKVLPRAEDLDSGGAKRKRARKNAYGCSRRTKCLLNS